MVKYAELKEYMIDKTKVILTDLVNSRLKDVKKENDFVSDSETVEYLLKMEAFLKSAQMIRKSVTCENCGEDIVVQKKIPRKFRHWHLDRSNCDGKLSNMKFGLNKEPKKEASTEASEVMRYTPIASEVTRDIPRASEVVRDIPTASGVMRDTPKASEVTRDKKGMLTVEDIDSWSEDKIRMDRATVEEIKIMTRDAIDRYHTRKLEMSGY